jgi:TatD DNase family protein
MLTDSHCHLDFPELAAQLPAVLERMAQAHVSRAMCISVTLEDFPRVLALAQTHPQLYATVGVHPDNLEDREPSLAELLEGAKHPKVLAIGETGLDYFRIGDNHEARAAQQRRFATHIEAGVQTGKPLVIHTRSASIDTLAMMRTGGADECSGVMHCFTETAEVARQALDLGFYISFSGIVTFKNAQDLREVVKLVPLDRMLIETDAPYLAPVPVRGRLNEPAYVAHTAAFIAQLIGISTERLAEMTSSNFDNLFKPLEH